MREDPFIGLLAACLTSVVVHGVAYASLAFHPPSPAEPPPSRVTMRVQPPKPATPEPPKPAPEPPQRADPPKRVAREPEKAPPPETVEPPAAEPAPLSGVTLTNESGTGSFSSLVGDGSSWQGPLGPVPPRAEPKPLAARPAAAPARPPVPPVPLVAVADLSERPRPPALADALREHYPPDARQRGVGGSATVKAHIESDGRIRTVSLLSETFVGFGEACRRALVGSRWSPPKDREGRAVSTAIRYTCRFVVQP